MKTVPMEIEQILKKAKVNLQKTYGKRLKGTILYGSYARGDTTEDSDIDLIVLLEDMDDPCGEIIRASRALGDLELTYDTLISILPFEETEFKNRRLPVILNAKREGITI